MRERAGAPKKLPGWVWGGLIGCAIIMSWMGWNTWRAHQQLVETFGGEQHLATVRTARQVFATRLGPHPGLDKPQHLEDFVAVAEPLDVTPGLSSRIQRLLTSSSSYHRDEPVTRIPRYGYRLRFVGEGAPVEAWVCLECGTVEYVVNGKSVGGGLFLPVSGAVRDISKELFPGDSAIEEAANR
jgi:hypothetical protein